MTKLSFTILEDLSVTRLLFLDTSDYSATPISPTLHVKFPDFKKIHSTPIQFGQINIINTLRLKYVDCVTDFPDGVYEFTFETGNKSCVVESAYFRTTSAWKKLDAALQNFDFNNKDLLEKFNKINLYLRGAEAVVHVNQLQAQQLYKEAINLLNCFNKNVSMLTKQCCN